MGREGEVCVSGRRAEALCLLGGQGMGVVHAWVGGGDADIWGCTRGSGCDMALHTRLRGQASRQQGRHDSLAAAAD